MIYRDMQSVGSGRLSKFVLQNASSNIEIWDVTDPVEVKRIDANLNGSNLEYVIPTDTLKEFIAFNKTSGFKTPVYQGSSDVGYVNNQDLHGLTPPDMIIYSHPDFISYANQLADIHRQNDGMNVLVTTPQLVYNEFSSGAPDVSALRNFLRMFYDNASLPEEIPRYLLLFGDGSYYNTKSFSGNTNYIFTYQSKNSLNETTSFTSDDYFALLDPSDAAVSGIIDVGVGRIPVKSTTEAQTAINKIKQYISPSSNGDWKNILTFIGDDEDGNSHMRQSDELAEYVDTNYPSFNIEKIYLDAFQQETTPSGERYPDVHDAIENRINNGTLILNYTGHGGELGLAHERIIETTDIVNWKNAPKFPLFITASCEVCRFDDYERTSGGELMYLNAQGGAIALFTTTRLVYSDANSKMNKKFFKYFFERDTLNEKYRLGDVFMFAKREVGVSENNRKFALIGDPALELAYPDKNVVTNTINEKDIYADSVTISALSKVTVKGHVENINGVKQEQFDGLVYPVVYDKKLLVTTLANDGGSPFKYKQRSNILYRGKVSVNNGEFSFSFVVPKDISYKYGTGKISYYAYNNNVDFQGSCEEFYIGGTADSIIEDNEGPEIDIYLNDKNFVSGGITDESPELLAFFRDSSGINTMGTGIGHDITVMLDNKQNNKIVLNKYYEADLNTYKSGKVNYDFSEIPEGSHTLFLKAWDVYNNSSEESIDFIVTSKEDIKISHVFNYPNPFTTYTEFHFAHNQANQELDVMIKIFTISGKLVKTIRKTIMTDGFRSNEITWNGLDDYGDRIGKGVYVYQLRVRTPDGKIDEKIEKLVILR